MSLVSCTEKVKPWGSLSLSKENNNIYLHLWNWIGGVITVNGLLSQVQSASFLDSGDNLTFVQEEKVSALTLQLPEINQGNSLRIIKLTVDSKKFDKTKGPEFLPLKVSHVNHKKITGKITITNGVNFSITGNEVLTSKRGFEIYEEQVKTVKFTINGHTRFRYNRKGDIRTVHSLKFKEGQDYHVVYSHYKNGSVVEIITELE